MALLTGMTEDGREVPVQVDTSGRLVAEGLTGATGPQGPAGPAGKPSEFSGGSSATPGLSPVGDPATGIYSPGTSQLAASTNGIGRLFVDAIGNVGVGGPPGNNRLEILGGQVKVLNPGKTSAIRVGLNTASNQSAQVDLIGDTTYSDYGFRIQRNAGGANANTELVHRGSGELRLTTPDAAGSITLYTSGLSRLQIKTSGTVTLYQVGIYAGNAEAKQAGLVVGDVYRKPDGTLMVAF